MKKSRNTMPLPRAANTDYYERLAALAARAGATLRVAPVAGWLRQSGVRPACMPEAA